ncbi:unnamed protein product, partial [Brassica oleracea var. botrytis]
ITFEYKRLENHCSKCLLLSHKSEHCPSVEAVESLKEGPPPENDLKMGEQLIEAHSDYQARNYSPRRGPERKETRRGQNDFHQWVDIHGRSFGERISTRHTRNPPPVKLIPGEQLPPLRRGRESSERQTGYSSPPYTKKNYHTVPPESPGRGGLFLFWKKEINLNVLSSTKRYIDTVISNKGVNFHTTFVYREPDQTRRQEVWDNLSTLHYDNSTPWFLTGDFNEIIDNSEKAIGNGLSTKVWKDSWISLDENIKSFGPIQEEALDLRVSDLLTDDLKWNKQIIERFLPGFADQIQCLKPSQRGVEDSYVWQPLPSGVYSTRSGYNAMIIPLQNRHTNRPDNEFDWIKDVCRIPLKETVHIAVTDTFKTAVVRFRSAICLPPSGVSHNIISWVCWTIWKDRYSLIFEGKGDLPENLATKSIALAREWSEAQVSTAKSQKTYSPPLNDRLNELPYPNIAVCMSDAAWEATRFRAGLAWVIKGELTSEVRRGSSVQDFVNSPLVGEALAIREGLFMAANQGISNLWCCSDNLTLIRAITHKIQRKELQGIIKDIHNLSSAFVSLDFFHVSRENNEEADALAKVVLRNSHM